jgi:hypothetical protein
VAKIELPESWAGVAEPLRALMSEVDREAHADRAHPFDVSIEPGDQAVTAGARRRPGGKGRNSATHDPRREVARASQATCVSGF